MNYRNARLAKGFLSLDKLAGKIDLTKAQIVSDNGAGVERMIGDLDRRPGDVEREESDAEMAWLKKFHAAETKLRRLEQGRLIPILALICKNGKHRDESIQEIASLRNISLKSAKARYYAHRKKIEEIFQ